MQDRVSLKNLIATLLADNSVGAVTPAKYRQCLEALTDSAMIIESDSAIQVLTVTIPSADILTGNTTPIVLIESPGPGHIVKVISAMIKIVYGTTPYATHTNFLIQYETQNVNIIGASPFGVSSDAYNLMNLEETNGVAPADIEDNAVILTVDAGDPTAGDSDIEITLYYSII